MEQLGKLLQAYNMNIRRNSTNKVAKNFTESEIFNASFGTTGINSFDFSDKTITGAQIIRDYFNEPLRVNASYRTVQHELKKNRSGQGQHPKKTALDLSFQNENTNLKYHQEILKKGELYNLLREAGINGFGLYDNFAHIDSRAGGNQPDNINGNFAFWDSRVTTKKKLPA